MRVTEIKPNMLILEYRQDENDKDYGSCLWARFYFNLDRYELLIESDCGEYGYKWYETPASESFLELMTRCDKWYVIDKLYGDADVFNYEETKKKFYEYFGEEEEDIEKLDAIFRKVECYGEPESSEAFLRDFENDGDFYDVWEYCEFDYPADALKIVSIFYECIRPKIIEILKEQKNE